MHSSSSGSKLSRDGLKLNKCSEEVKDCVVFFEQGNLERLSALTYAATKADAFYESTL